MLGIITGGGAQAQDAAPAPGQAQEEERPAPEARKEFVEEVVVTAQKREENIQDVPVSISALSGEILGALVTGGPDVRALSGRVPSLILESSFGRIFPRFYIRGLGNSDFDLNASQPVSMVVDEVVLENPMVKAMPLWDLDRIEVLRGPQGTLFGRNTPAGIVKFETKKPTRELDGEFKVSYGTFNTIDLSGGVGGPLTDTLSARFSGLYQGRSDWVDNGYTNRKNVLGGYDITAYRLQLLWQPSDQFTGLLNLHGWDVDGTARIFRANIIQPGTNRLVDDFKHELVFHDGRNEQRADARGGVLRLEHAFSGATLTAVTGFETLEMYSRGDIDGGYRAVFAPPSGPGLIPFPAESADGIPDLDQFTQEVRLASSGEGAFGWLVGAFYFKEELQVDSFSYDSLAPGNPQNGYAVQRQQADAYALFASVDYRPSDLWTFKAGLRFSHDEKDFVAERPQPIFQPPLVRPITARTDDNSVSWDLSAALKVNRDVSVYGRLATSFRAPSIQGRIMFAPDFDGGTNPATNGVTVADTEEILSAEVGLKSILANNRLRLNLAAYAYDVDGQQVTAVGGQYNTATLLNVDSTRGWGLETDVEFIPSAHAWVNLGVSYNSTEIRDRNLTVASCGGGCTMRDPLTANGLALINGNSLPNAPEWVVAAVFNFQSSPLHKGFFGSLDLAYSSDRSFFLYDSEEFHGDSFEAGLRVGYGWSQGAYEVALYGRNLTNEKILQGGIDFNNLTGMTNDPRTLGIEFIGRF